MRVTFNELAERELTDVVQYDEREFYGLLYVVAGDELRILAVINLKRRPGYWVGRT
jgi:hypothetical protein